MLTDKDRATIRRFLESIACMPQDDQLAFLQLFYTVNRAYGDFEVAMSAYFRRIKLLEGENNAVRLG